MDTPIRRDASFPFCGRLIAMPTLRNRDLSETENFEDELSIDFPAMPDSVDLNRSAEYSVSVPPVYADGVHQFMGTRPLEIPFSFRLHSFDQQYCPKGAFTLLQLAARLHSFVVPINTGEKGTPAQAGTTNANDDSTIDKKAADPNGGVDIVAIIGNRITPPVTCRLELIFTGQDSPGIVCNGYVREVSVKLNGPWLKGPGTSRNLPSSGDFGFTFVHHPGHGNSGLADLGDLFAQAYANVVKDQFYNTRQLAKSASYQGINEPPPVFLLTDSPPATGRIPNAAPSRQSLLNGNRIR
jgi:hypothetical protein